MPKCTELTCTDFIKIPPNQFDSLNFYPVDEKIDDKRLQHLLCYN